MEKALSPLGFEREARGFSPHVTLGRASRPGPEMNRLLTPKIAALADTDLGSFTVDRFCLKKSTLTRGGPIYDDLADSLSEIQSEVLEQVKPPCSRTEKRLKEIRVPSSPGYRPWPADRGLDMKAMLVGSAARDTWLAGDHDLDIFLGIPEDSDLGEALQVARTRGSRV